MVCSKVENFIFSSSAAVYGEPEAINAAGADPQGTIGELHNPETHLIPLVLQSAISGKPVKVFGTDYATADGTCIRDYVHVTDLAQAPKPICSH